MNIATLRNWEFDSDEVSASFYRLRAIHTLGSSFEMARSDNERLLSEAKAAARKIESEIAEKVAQRKRRDNSDQGRFWQLALHPVGVRLKMCRQNELPKDCPMALRLRGVPVF